MRTRQSEVWVVYKTSATKNLIAQNVICTQEEWEALDRANPGHLTLVRDKIGSETEAERLVRSLLPPPPAKK